MWSSLEEKKSYLWKVGKKGWKIVNICLIHTHTHTHIYVDNSFVGIRELIPMDKSCKCYLKIDRNSLTYV